MHLAEARVAAGRPAEALAILDDAERRAASEAAVLVASVALVRASALSLAW